MKYVLGCTLCLLFVLCGSCGQSQINLAKDNPRSETNGVADSPAPAEKYDTRYEYTDSAGKRLIIQNGLPKGETYTDHDGKKYLKVIFWTRIINETAHSLELKIDFPVNSHEVAGLPGKYYKVLVPPDTMTIDQEPLYNYGLTRLTSFLDQSIHQPPPSLKRTIHPKESSGFYFVILFDNGVAGPFRARLSIQGQNLFYQISRYDKRSLLDEQPIHCGSIKSKDLMLKK